MKQSSQLFLGIQSLKMDYSQYKWHFSLFSGYRNFNAKIKSTGFDLTSFLQMKNTLMMLDDIKLVVLEKSKFERGQWHFLTFSA